jgi:magnesium transporter
MPADSQFSSDLILELISYDQESSVRYTNIPVEEILQKLNPAMVNWINLDGPNLEIIEKLQEYFRLHSLLVEDVLNDQRPKSEEYDDYLFFSLKMLYRFDGSEIEYEQISFVLGDYYLISFQEKPGDLFQGFRERIRLNQGKVRTRRADYLLYRLIDIITDNYYNILDKIGDQIEDIEDEIHNNPSNDNFKNIQRIKKELIFLRRALHPLRDALNQIVKNDNHFIDDINTRFYSDVIDNVVHLGDSIETYKDLLSGLMDIHINTMNTRLNEVMRVLTVISTIFIPLTFIVGVYGMNFHYIPELEWRWGYYSVWGIMLFVVSGMLIFFKFKKWF